MDDATGHVHAFDPTLSRRGVLQGMVALAALAACSPADSRSPAAAPSPRAPNAAGLSAYVLAMHLHASASEGVGSVRAHLAQAAATGVDVCWFTEHDWRRRRLLFRETYSFTPDERQLGGTWTLDPLADVGRPAPGSGATFVGTPVSPDDPAAVKGSLRVTAISAGGATTVGRRVHSEKTSRLNFMSRIAGRTVAVDVLPADSGPQAWAEVFFGLSFHPAAHGRPAGLYSLLYRLRTDVTERTVTADGTTGIVDVPVRRGSWQSVTFDLTGDVGRAWPDLDPRDNALVEIQFRAASDRRATADAFFGHLRFQEQTGYDAVGVEHDLVARYADEEPSVLGIIGTEISLGPHMNQFGGPQDPYPYGDISGLDHVPGDIRRSVTQFIHSRGGVACINHPAAIPVAGETGSQAIARDLLGIGAGGADMVEVGYGHTGLASLPGHLAAWDTLSRNGLFLTGNGVSDDHSGQDWATQQNRYVTGVWSSGRDERPFMDALLAGRVYASYLGSFSGTLDMTVDDAVPMGAVSVRGQPRRTLRIDVEGLPKGGAVQVVRGPVDYAGTADPNPGTSVVATLGASDLQRSREVPIDTRDDCFHRLQITDAAGAVVAFGQPIWALASPPEAGIPAARRTPA